jgi:hypothetical protein
MNLAIRQPDELAYDPFPIPLALFQEGGRR